jgi:NADPH-dependent 7-cyano-7-deazaguanine reductase QueF-like protein
MEKPIITLDGRNPGCKNTLVLVSFDKNFVKYKLVTPYSNALRCGTDAENSDKITWIDPSGGPMMSIGYKVNDLELIEIYHSKKFKAYILKFKKV